MIPVVPALPPPEPFDRIQCRYLETWPPVVVVPPPPPPPPPPLQGTYHNDKLFTQHPGAPTHIYNPPYPQRSTQSEFKYDSSPPRYYSQWQPTYISSRPPCPPVSQHLRREAAPRQAHQPTRPEVNRYDWSQHRQPPNYFQNGSSHTPRWPTLLK
jgi:hypothetical protein